MGKELRRVPLDFDWPLRETWSGFINEFSRLSVPCIHCNESGMSPLARRLSDKWYGKVPFSPEENGSTPFTAGDPHIRAFAERNVNNAPEFYGTSEMAIIGEAGRLARLFNSQWAHHLNEADVAVLFNAGRLEEFTHTLTEEGWKPRDVKSLPAAKDVNAWGIFGMNLTSSHLWVLTKAVCEQKGVSATCEHCLGEGSTWRTPQAKKAYEDWEPTPPPQGEGYQLWENTTEGSPVSPVFKTLHDLCVWCADNAHTFAYQKATYEEWYRMLDDGLVYHQEGNLVLM